MKEINQLDRPMDADLLQVGFFLKLIDLIKKGSNRHYAIEVVAATLVFFVCFSVINLFSPVRLSSFQFL